MVLSHLENTKTYWQDWVRSLTVRLSLSFARALFQWLPCFCDNRGLSDSSRAQIPFEYQKEVIRSAITLKVLTFEETGSVIGESSPLPHTHTFFCTSTPSSLSNYIYVYAAAATTSIPPYKDGPRNDARYHWLRYGPVIANIFIQLGAAGDREAMNRFYASTASCLVLLNTASRVDSKEIYIFGGIDGRAQILWRTR
jgi:hypothetical protein